MANTNNDRLNRAMELLKNGLAPYVERELKNTYQGAWFEKALENIPTPRLAQALGTADKPSLDAAAVLGAIKSHWEVVFKKTLGTSSRSLVFELGDVRNKWAHQGQFSYDDTYRALDTAQRVLDAVSAAKEAEELDAMKQEVMRTRFDEQARVAKRKATGVAVEGQSVSGLKPWREVITPHADVMSGNYRQAEFAADLWQVAFGGSGVVSAEYKNPVEFFRRTFLTASLRDLLAGALRRVAGKGGDPVVQLQTNFGGGKTHSMLALWHLFSDVPPKDLPGMEEMAAGAGVPSTTRVVLVGTKISPGNPDVKHDGTRVCTLWGELAWQLGGREAYEVIRQDDEKATNPGKQLDVLFAKYGPALILIDEWVAYARQLHDSKDLPGGDFETQFTFAQALTESAKAARNVLLVISLPASDASGRADEIEVGGDRGRTALERLANVVGRMESSWKPATAEEGFEIVRRRLFEPLPGDAFKYRDATAGKFSELYRTQHQEFPPECREAEYERRIKAAYPIHPEIFDRLYTDWGALSKFQRTRGVLRLMATVIHSLWNNDDKNPLILPAHIPIGDLRVQGELTRYLSENWPPVIEKDVDGPDSLPVRLDGEKPNLGKHSACRRVARTIYLGSAPTSAAAHKGIEDRRVRLGCVLPGESPSVFGDALRHLAAAATYLYQDGGRSWYSTHPTIIKVAEERAEELKNRRDEVSAEVKRRTLEDIKKRRGDFERVHPFLAAGDVPDEADARLVVLDPANAHTRNTSDSPARKMAAEILKNRASSAPRLNQNALVFLAVDAQRLVDLEDAVRRYLAWKSIVDEAVQLELQPSQKKQAETRRDDAERTLNPKLEEAWQWLLVPCQDSPTADIQWDELKLSGSNGLAVRASKKLRDASGLVIKLGATMLRHEMDKVPLWHGGGNGNNGAGHVEVRLLVEYFARYLYLPRLLNTKVLVDAVADGISSTAWNVETFAFAEAFNESTGRYAGLKAGQMLNLPADGSFGLLVKPEVAQAQFAADAAAEQGVLRGAGGASGTNEGASLTGGAGGTTQPPPTTPPPPVEKNWRHFHGSAVLPSTAAAKIKFGEIYDEVIAHLAKNPNANVRVTLEIAADFSGVPGGAGKETKRTVETNVGALRFAHAEWEEGAHP